MPNAAIHPTAHELAAFGLGKLSDAASAAVAGHLEECLACRKTLDSLPADSFIGKVQAAKPNASSLPARTARTGNASNVPTMTAAPFIPPEDLPPDLASYDKFRFLRELGRGGMGVVYQAEQTVMGRTVAVKIINPTVLDHPDALPRFLGEVKAAAKLDHPNIVRAHDAEQVGSMHLLVMEYVEGTSLAELVAKTGPQPIAYACHCIHQAALGLQHAFEQGMVHRDVKPQNLMVNPRGQVKVLDFGLARMRSERKGGGGLTEVDAFMGTPEYVSPEQATDAHSADTRADIYSLGCTLFFLLTGRPPFQEDSIVKLIHAQIEKEPPVLRDVRPDVPAELSALVARMLVKDPARRFQTPIEVAQELAVFIQVKPARKGVNPGTAAWYRRGPVLAGVGTVVLALGLGAWLLAGVVFKTKVKTPDGEALVVLEIDQPDAEVTVDGRKINVRVPGDNKPVEIEVEPGLPHRLRVRKDGFAVVSRDVVLQSGKSAPIRVRLEPMKVPTKHEERPAAPRLPLPAERFVPLFNGKDTTGWKTHPTQPGNWHVEKGVLASSGQAVSHLYTERADYKDFHLRVETRINPTGDSGVEFRTGFGSIFPAKNPVFPLSYEAQIYGDTIRHSFPRATGSLYAVGRGPVVGLSESPVSAGEWFTLEVIAEDNHIVIKVNGKMTADYTDEKRAFRSGHIALQQFNAHTVAEFRKIEIKELPVAKP